MDNIKGFLKICILLVFATVQQTSYAQRKLPSPLRYPDTTIADFGLGLDLAPIILPDGDLLVHISLLGSGFYKCPFLGRSSEGNLLYGRPVREEELSRKYSAGKVIYIADRPEYFFADRSRRWRHIAFADIKSLRVDTETPLLIGGNPLVGEFTVVENREGTFLIKVSAINEGKSYWPGGKNPWVYPPNPHIGFGKGYDAEGNWAGDKTKVQLSYVEVLDKKKWMFSPYRKVREYGDMLTLEFYQSAVRLHEVEVLGKKDKQVLIHWDVDQVSLYETGVIDGELTFFEKKLPNGMTSTSAHIYSGVYMSGTQLVYPDQKKRNGFIMGGNPGILTEYYYEEKERCWKERPVKMKGGDLHVQTLGAPHWIDWDGDGLPDVIAGDASGFIWFFKNAGTAENPIWRPGLKLTSQEQAIQHQAGLTGSIQGPNEKRWGYVHPLVVDWDGDGLLDILCNDIRGAYTLYKNVGTKTEPALDSPRLIQYDGENYIGAWRSKPAVIPHDNQGEIEPNRDNLLAINSAGILCLYRRESVDANLLTKEIPTTWKNGDAVRIVGFAGHEGRATLSVCDYNGDGKWDVLFGQGVHMHQSKEVNEAKPYSTAYVLINKGTNQSPVFERPRVICQQDGHPIDMDRHGCWVSPILEENGRLKHLLAGGEDGRFYLFKNPELCTDTDD